MDASPWSLDRIGRLMSGNEPGLTVAQEYQKKEINGIYSSNDYERARRDGYASPREHQEALTAHIERHGLVNAPQASAGYLLEGYHRYAAFRKLGRRSMPVRRI